MVHYVFWLFSGGARASQPRQRNAIRVSKTVYLHGKQRASLVEPMLEQLAHEDVC